MAPLEFLAAPAPAGIIGADFLLVLQWLIRGGFLTPIGRALLVGDAGSHRLLRHRRLHPEDGVDDVVLNVPHQQAEHPTRA